MSRIWLPGETVFIEDLQRWENGLGGGATATFQAASYGAKGDGVTDDTAALQACINAAAGKGRVHVPSALTCRTGVLILPSNTALVLDGTLTLRAGANQPVLAIQGGNKNVLIEGRGTIDGNKAGQVSGLCSGVQADFASNIIVRDITVQNCLAMPVNIVNCSRVLVQNITGKDSGNSFEIAANSTDCWFVGCRVSGINDLSLVFYGGPRRCGAIQNLITAGVSIGIGIFSDLAQPAPCSDILIADNIIHSNVGNAVLIGWNDGAAVAAVHRNITVSNNRMWNNLTYPTSNYKGAGVQLLCGRNVLIQGNMIGPDGAGGETSGIYLENTGRVFDTTIQGNFIRDQGAGGGGDSIGINTDGGDVRTTIRGNTIVDTLIKTTFNADGSVTYSDRAPLMGSGLRGTAGPGAIIENNSIRGCQAVSNMNMATNAAIVRQAGIGWQFEQPLEIGSQVTPGATYLDFHSSGSKRDYDSRIIATAGSTTADGGGLLDYIAKAHGFHGTVQAFDVQAGASYANDAAAAAGGVALGQLYRNGSQLMIRVA